MFANSEFSSAFSSEKFCPPSQANGKLKSRGISIIFAWGIARNPEALMKSFSDFAFTPALIKPEILRDSLMSAGAKFNNSPTDKESKIKSALKGSRAALKFPVPCPKTQSEEMISIGLRLTAALVLTGKMFSFEIIFESKNNFPASSRFNSSSFRFA